MWILDWIETTSLSLWMQSSAFAFPAAEVVHVLAITLVFGTIAIVDLRILGLAGVERAYAPLAHDTLRIVWVCFGVAVLTGGLMFISQPNSYFNNSYFLAKMALLALAGVNMGVMEFVISRTRETWGAGAGSVPLSGRVCGAVSLSLWTAIIVCGRWIGFTMFQIPNF